jgi:hypothetical protein
MRRSGVIGITIAAGAQTPAEGPFFTSNIVKTGAKGKKKRCPPRITQMYDFIDSLPRKSSKFAIFCAQEININKLGRGSTVDVKGKPILPGNKLFGGRLPLAPALHSGRYVRTSPAATARPYLPPFGLPLPPLVFSRHTNP